MEVFNELVESIQKESHSMTMIAQLNKELTRLIKHLNDDKKIFQILRKLEEKEVPLGGAQDSVVTAMLPFTALCAGKSSCILSLQSNFSGITTFHTLSKLSIMKIKVNHCLFYAKLPYSCNTEK